MQKPLILFSVFTLLIFSACKKKSADDGGVLCNGNGSTSYFPLTVGNAWYFNTAGANTYDTVTGSWNNNYFVQYIGSNGATTNDTFTLSANGDIIVRSASDTAGHLLIPGAPVVGQSWNYTDLGGTTYYLSVVSLKAAPLTSACLYANCLEIKDSISPGSVALLYYAPGIGPVETSRIAGPASTALLTGIVLK